MQSLGQILNKQMKQSSNAGWKHVEATMVVEKTNDVLQELFGVASKRFAQAVYFKERTITITCLSSVMAQEIKLNEKQLIEKVNSKLGSIEIGRVRYIA